MRRYLIFAAASIGIMMYSIDSTAVAVAFPNFMKDFDSNVLWAGWTLSIFLIAATTAMPLIGNLSDTFGHKRVFLSSLILFTASSLACGLAPNILVLIVFRFFQGIGGASFLPTAAGIVTEHFPESRDRAIGLFTSIFPIGGVIGPNLGGWIVAQYSWRYVFYINLPIGIGLIIMAMILLPPSRALSRPRIDLKGASFFGGAILFFMIGLNFMGEDLSMRSVFLAATFLAASFFSAIFFFRQEEREANPILDVVLLKAKPFLVANIYNMIIGIGVFAIFSFIPLYAISVHHLSTLLSGMILTPRSVAMIPAAAVTSFLLRRWGYRWPMIVGLLIMSFATILLGPGFQPWKMIGIDWGVTETLIFLLTLSGIGIGITFPPSNNACIELMPEKVATITGLRGMFRTVGGVLGISIITIILHTVPDPVTAFRIVFISFGLGLLCAVPLAFLLPTGKEGWENDAILRT